MAVTLVTTIKRFEGTAAEMAAMNVAGIPAGSTFYQDDTGLIFQLSAAGAWSEKKSSVTLLGSNVEAVLGTVIPAKANLMGISDGVNIQAIKANSHGTLLASAARTAIATSPNQTNYNYKGVIVTLNITAASGTGGLSVLVHGNINGIPARLNPSPTAITAIGKYSYEVYPGANTAGVAGSFRVNQRTAGVLPDSWYAEVSVGDASSYTYSLEYALIN